VLEYLYGTLRAIVHAHQSQETQDFDLEQIAEACRALAPFPHDLHTTLQRLAHEGGLHAMNPEGLVGYLKDQVFDLYEHHEMEVGADQLRQIEKMVILRTIDDVWVNHLEAMEQLRDSVRLRAYGQRDPLVEYKIEAQRMYGTLMDTVAQRVANIVFKVRIQQAPVRTTQVIEGRGEGAPDTKEDEAIHRHDENDPAKSTGTVHADHVGRNDPCPCGSGKKFKKCGLLDTEEHKRRMTM
ncbi:MAG TPA: SEC-C metal-binding domain-containing protein, partial [Candidatus Paceibacterota bacterium]|nr:SEC-C metal-binding domain-containing protein [Candidatus Paceibacterota bacterium]